MNSKRLKKSSRVIVVIGGSAAQAKPHRPAVLQSWVCAAAGMETSSLATDGEPMFMMTFAA